MFKKRNLLVFSLIFVMLSAVAVISNAAATKTANTKVITTTFKGILIDKDCSTVKDPTKHTKDCLLMPDCAKSGYGIDIKQKNATYKFYTFDPNGQKLVKAYLSKTKKKDNITIIVTGSLNVTTIAVTKITEDNYTSESADATKSASASGVDSTVAKEYTGWIIDTDCVGMDPLKHTRSCLQMPMCIESGMGLLIYDSKVKATDYKFIQFDEASQRYGVDLINNIPVTETKNVTIKVTATFVDVVNATSKKNEKQLHINSISFTAIKGVSTFTAPNWSESAIAAK
jgi:hypothetical protein